MFEKCEFLWKMKHWSCEFCEKWNLKLWILWKMRLWNCEFCEKWDFENVNFVKSVIFNSWIFGQSAMRIAVKHSKPRTLINFKYFQEEDKGKRSRNPSFSNNAQHPGNKGRRSRTASEGDQVVETKNSYQGRHSTGGSSRGPANRGRANSGGSKPVRVGQNKRTKSNSECSAASIEKWKSIQKIASPRARA